MASLSYKLTLITILIVFNLLPYFVHEKCAGVGLAPTTFVIIFTAHRSIHLRHGGLKYLQKLAGFLSNAIELLVWWFELN